MVDFYDKLHKLREWRKRKARVTCECQTESPTLCFELEHEGYKGGRVECMCKCHSHEKLSAVTSLK